MEHKNCPKCGSAKWMAEGLSADNTVTVAVKTDPGKFTWVAQPIPQSGVLAEACGECGYLEYRLLKPGSVYHEWRKHNS